MKRVLSSLKRADGFYANVIEDRTGGKKIVITVDVYLSGLLKESAGPFMDQDEADVMCSQLLDKHDPFIASRRNRK